MLVLPGLIGVKRMVAKLPVAGTGWLISETPDILMMFFWLAERLMLGYCG